MSAFEGEYHCTGCNKLVTKGHQCSKPNAQKVSFSSKPGNKNMLAEINKKLDMVLHLLREK